MPDQKIPIRLTLADTRADGGKTANYHVFGGGGNVAVKNGKGETVTKAVLVGGQGTLYIANPVAEEYPGNWVLMPERMFDDLLRGQSAAVKGAAPKGKGKR